MNSLDHLLPQFGWWWIFIFVVLATYFWRGLGVLIAGHVSQDGEIFKWLSCVTYALVGALTFKLILFPIGQLSEVSISYRIVTCCICLIYMIRFNGRLIPGLILGSVMMMAYGLYISYL
jgi:branched-subunit amino acid transport protein